MAASHYDILGIARTASPKEIYRAWRTLITCDVVAPLSAGLDVVSFSDVGEVADERQLGVIQKLGA